MKKDRWEYYSDIEVQEQIVKCCINREVIFMDKDNNSHCIRGLKISHPDMFKQLIGSFNFINKNYNIYVSSAIYNHLPFFPFDLRERSKYTNQWFMGKSLETIDGYDILIDMDNNNDKVFYDELVKVLDFLVKNNITFYYYNSSIKGIQIIIPYRVIKKVTKGLKFSDNLEDKKSFGYFVRNFIFKLKSMLELECLCTKLAGVHNRIMKCPYSLVDNIVCIPFKNIFQDNTVHKKVYDYLYLSNTIKNLHQKGYFKNRGLPIFNDEFSQTSFKKMYNKYFI